MNQECFLNSKTWQDFQRNVGRKVFELSEDAYLIEMEISFGKNYLYSPSPHSIKYLDEIKKIAKQENAVFFKYEPLIIEHRTWNMEQLKSQGFREAVKELQPQRTIVLDLEKSEADLLGDMHQKTRYNIRLAQKRGIKVRASENKEKDFEKFWNLLQETSKRDKFHTHAKDYYKKLLKLDIIKLYFGYKGSKLHVAAIVIFHDRRATYLHGASDYKYRRDMAPHALHWSIIKKAKQESMLEYDFWGIDEKRWPGVTRFKRGFGGKELKYVGSYDYIFKKYWYWAYKIKN